MLLKLLLEKILQSSYSYINITRDTKFRQPNDVAYRVAYKTGADLKIYNLRINWVRMINGMSYYLMA